MTQVEGNNTSSSPVSIGPAHEGVWDIDLFVIKQMAQIFRCTKCFHVPKKLMADQKSAILCEPCSLLLKDNQKIVPATHMQNNIGQMELKCKNKLCDPTPKVEAPAAAVADEKKDEAAPAAVVDEKKDEAAPDAGNECKWTGQLKEWQAHNDNKCTLTLKTCEHCNKYECSRKLLTEHYNLCSEKSIDCPQGCGNQILRRNTDQHIAKDNTDFNVDGCSKTSLLCINNECEIKKERAAYQQHVEHECSKRIRICKYKDYGCNKPSIKDEELQKHYQDSKLEHLQFSVDYLIRKRNEDLGIIKIYCGNINKLENGWKICNGKNGTPDLRDNFMKSNTLQNLDMDDEKEQNQYSLCYIMKVS